MTDSEQEYKLTEKDFYHTLEISCALRDYECIPTHLQSAVERLSSMMSILYWRQQPQSAARDRELASANKRVYGE